MKKVRNTNKKSGNKYYQNWSYYEMRMLNAFKYLKIQSFQEKCVIMPVKHVYYIIAVKTYKAI